jgi:hypothetical protein
MLHYPWQYKDFSLKLHIKDFVKISKKRQSKKHYVLYIWCVILNKCQIDQKVVFSVKIVKGGVLQGSVLGPLLFLLYINDIADNTQSFSRLFADDTSLLYSSYNVNEIEVIVNSD